MTQACAHNAEPQRLCQLPGGIEARLCQACIDELKARLCEVEKDETPLEYYAREGKMPAQPCRFDYNATSRTKKPRLCGLVCDEGQTLCPRHRVLVAEQERLKAEKAAAKATPTRPG